MGADLDLVAELQSPAGWECYLQDLFEAGPSVLTEGALDPVKINQRYVTNGLAAAPTPDAVAAAADSIAVFRIGKA